MAKDVIHWAEQALNEPYPVQGYSWIRLHIAGTMVAVGAAASALVAGAVLVASRAQPSTQDEIQIATFQVRQSYLNTTADAVLSEHHADAAPASSAILLPKREHAPGQSNLAARLIQPDKLAAAAKKDGARARADASASPPAPRPAPSPSPSESEAVVAKAAPETTTPKVKEKKPVDIAPGEKLGIQAVLADGITLLNGRKIRTGSPLPNGEILVATDPSKGMAETDRRVLVVTP